MLVSADAKQLEWRTVLELSRDPVGIAEVLNNDDTHQLNQVTFGLPSRLIAKIYLFRTIFRGTGYSFANDPDFSHVSSDPDYWDDINYKFYNKYKGINECHYKWKELCEAGVPIVSPFGREWDVPLLNSYGKINWTQFTNYPVQGTGADVMKIARISMYNRVKKLGIPVLFIQTVHDSIVVDCPTELAQFVVNLFHEVFRDLQMNLKKLFGYEWIVPLECEVKVGVNQKDMKKLDYLPGYVYNAV
jgi:DNA polymerase-1